MAIIQLQIIQDFADPSSRQAACHMNFVIDLVHRVPRSWQDEKLSFFISLLCLKTYHLSYSIYKHDAIDIANPNSMQAACHMNFVIDLVHRVPRSWQDEKLSFFISLLCLKTYHLSYSIYKHDAIDIANPNSMQAACHMNFVIDPVYRRVSVAKW